MRLLKSILVIFIIGVGFISSILGQTALGLANTKLSGGEEEKIYEVFASQNQKHLIYSKFNNPLAPELYLFRNISGYQTKHKQITNNQMVEYNPVINNNGIFAYGAFDLRGNSSTVFLNGKAIRDGNRRGYYKSLAISNDYLLAVYETYVNQHFLFIYNLINSQSKFIPLKSGLYIEKMQFLQKDKVLLQAYNPNSRSMDIFLFDLVKGRLEPLIISPQTEVFGQVDFTNGNYTNGNFTITQLVEGGENVRLLFNGYYYLLEQRSLAALSKLNDFSGMLSWNVAYRLEGLIKLYQLIGDEKIKRQIKIIVANILQSTNAVRGLRNKNNPEFLWASKKYSQDQKTPISFLVNNARIFYPLLLACNQDILDKETEKQIIANAEGMCSYYEKHYNQRERLYHFPKEIKYWADGVWLPFNQQNTLGLVMIELFKRTKEEKYRIRLFEMAKKFRGEMEFRDNRQRLVWHYWPRIYYQGWDQHRKISSNTPNKPKSRDTLYEDISHAGTNVKFICAFNNSFQQEVFTLKDIQGISRNLDCLISDGFSPYLNGLDKAQANLANIKISNEGQRGYRFIPQYGWAELNNEKLKNVYLNLLPQTNPRFNCNMDLYSYLSAINSKELKQEKLILRRMTFSRQLRLVNTRVETYTSKNLKEYFTGRNQR